LGKKGKKVRSAVVTDSRYNLVEESPGAIKLAGRPEGAGRRDSSSTRTQTGKERGVGRNRETQKKPNLGERRRGTTESAQIVSGKVQANYTAQTPQKKHQTQKTARERRGQAKKSKSKEIAATCSPRKGRRKNRCWGVCVVGLTFCGFGGGDRGGGGGVKGVGGGWGGTGGQTLSTSDPLHFEPL